MKTGDSTTHLPATVYETVLEQALDAVLIVDPDGLRIVHANARAVQETGYSKAELTAMVLHDLADESEQALRDLIRPLQGRHRPDVEFLSEFYRNDGTTFPVELHVLLQDGYFIVQCRDLTLQQADELHHLEVAKLEAVGQLAGGIAHDFNNLLTIIRGNLRYLQEDIGDVDDDTQELFEDAFSAADDGASLTQRLLSFSRTQPVNPETLDLNQTVEEMVRFLYRTIGDNVDIEISHAPERPSVHVDKAQLESALLNLAVNAREAMRDGGVLSIDVSAMYIDPELESQFPVPAKGDYVAINVSDDGDGIEKEILNQVFNPFFSTKVGGKGTGLGLSTVYGFTRQSGGCCLIDSEPGSGTTVSLILPNVSAEETSNDRAEETHHANHEHTVLVVEDEPRVRRIAVRDLERMGYNTVEAENATIAKACLEEQKNIDVLFSDILMPGGMNGFDLAHWVQQHYPDIKILLTSGYHHLKSQAAQHQPPFTILKKPYSTEKLGSHLQALLCQ